MSDQFGDTPEKLLELLAEQPQGVRPDYGEATFRIQVIDTDIPQTRPSALSLRQNATTTDNMGNPVLSHDGLLDECAGHAGRLRGPFA